MNNKPIKTIKDGWFSVSIFEKERADGRKTYQISIDKAFKRDGADKVEHKSVSVFPENLLVVAQLCERAYWEINKLKDADFKARKGEPAAAADFDAFGDEIPY